MSSPSFVDVYAVDIYTVVVVAVVVVVADDFGPKRTDADLRAVAGLGPKQTRADHLAAASADLRIAVALARKSYEAGEPSADDILASALRKTRESVERGGAVLPNLFRVELEPAEWDVRDEIFAPHGLRVVSSYELAKSVAVSERTWSVRFSFSCES